MVDKHVKHVTAEPHPTRQITFKVNSPRPALVEPTQVLCCCGEPWVRALFITVFMILSSGLKLSHRPMGEHTEHVSQAVALRN